MTATEYPHRLRLRGGRNTHAARTPAEHADAVTACGYVIVGSGDHRLPDDALITCRNCAREMFR